MKATGKATALLVVLLFVAAPPSCPGLGLSLAGRYKLSLREFQTCDDHGAHTLRFDMRQRLLESGQPAFSGNVTFPQDFGPGMQGQVDIAEWGAGGWAPNFFTHKSRNLCKDLSRMAPGYMQSLAEALKVPARCPIPKGHYTVVDWQIDLSVPFPVLPYGHYRIDVAYSNATARLGCVRWILDCEKR